LEGSFHVVVGCTWVVDWVWEASQLNGLGNGADGCLDATSLLDLSPSSEHTFLDPSNKSLDDQDSFWSIQVLKVWIDTSWQEVIPVLPVTLPCCLSQLHDSSVGVVVDSSEKR